VSKVHSAGVRALHPHTLFRVFKYTIYGLLTLNLFFFFQEDFLASREVFAAGVAWDRLPEAFSATLDTAAWLLLLWLFELETAVIRDEDLAGALKWVMLALNTAAYLFILWAFYGYISKFGVLSNTLPFVIDDVCSLVGSGFTWVQDLDQYPPLDAGACAALQGQVLFQISGTEIIGTADAIRAARNLTIIDIINAADWLVIVALLEVEVYLQVKGLLTDRLLLSTKLTKGVLYTILFACAVYWGFLGDFLDFWDAFLWLVAFVFIELNIFQWHEEISEELAEEQEPIAHAIG
jgi:hypothetical protein